MIAGITVESGAGALLACSAFSLAVLGAGALIADGRRRILAARRHPLSALERVCTGARR